jgi:hypothetical protein
MNLIRTILLVLFATNFSFAQDSIPRFRKVINKLFQDYNIAELYEENDLILEKRDSGWFVKTTNRQDTIRQLYWNKTKNEYEELNFLTKSAAISASEFNKQNEKEENETKIKKQIFNTYPELNYDIFPYFGYDGCFYDNIKLLEKKSELNDNDMYTLGYSYSQLASNLINYNYEFYLKNLNFNLQIIKNSMNKNQLEKFLEYSEKAINYYKILSGKSPNFNTITGSINIKYHNEIISLYLNLLIYQNEEIALKYLLQHNLYSENINLYSKLMLDSCEKDAILFTAGDNDTFPILYYQLKNNYRKDILVINTSLLNDPRYSIMIKKGTLKYSFDEEFIKSKISQVILFNIKNNKLIDLVQLKDIISKNNLETESGTYLSLISNNFSLKLNNLNNITWNFTNEALYRNHLLLLDIIAKNNWEKPIYFTDYNSEDNYLGLTNYLQFEGLVYKLTSEHKETENNIGYIKKPEFIEQFLDKIELKNTNLLPVEEKELVDQIRTIYLRLSKYYLDNKSNSKALFTLNYCLTKFNNKISPLNFYSLDFIDLYQSLDENEKSENIKNEILKNLENKKHNYHYKTEEYINEKLRSHKEYLKNNYN